MRDRPLPLIEALGEFFERAERIGTDPGRAANLAELRQRVREPLRVAIAGRVKAGKSTLLNALIGERLAATDAQECTKVVTWYRHGIGYDVTAVLTGGERRALQFDRGGEALAIDLSGFEPTDFERIEVTWPAARLQHVTLIDTPGLEALDDAAARGTRRVLGLDGDRHSEVDAVIYLMRHLHRLDAEFLEAFADTSLANPSPVNAIAVLSRADEIGAGRLDALESAARIAERYGADRRIRALCATVTPVAGLIAESGRTIREHEGGSLRTLLGDLDATGLEELLLSVDRFADPDRTPLATGTRQELLRRLGIFGIRFSLDLMQRSATTTADIARALVDASGIDRLIGLLDEHFARRADLLRARSALSNLKALASTFGADDEARRFRADLERLEAGAVELGELRLLHLMLTGAVDFDEEAMREVNRLVVAGSPARKLGLPEDAGAEMLRAAALSRAENWRRRGAFPLADHAEVEACDIITASYERLHASLAVEE